MNIKAVVKLSLLSLPLLIAGCAVPAADFSVAIAPTTVTLQNDGAPQALTLTVVPDNSFSGSVQVSLSNLPPGITASSPSITVLPNALTQVMLNATNASVGTSNITLTATSGALSHTFTAPVMVTSAVTTAALSGSSFNFGPDLVSDALTQTVVTVTNTGGAPLTLNPALTGDPSFTLIAAQSCGTSLSAGSNCDIVVQYLPIASSSGQAATLNLDFGDVPSGTPQAVAISGSASQPVVPDFVLSAAPDTVDVRNNGSSRQLTFTATTTNGFANSVTVSFSNLPAGVTATPSTVTILPGQLGQVSLAASGATVANSNITLTGTSGALVHSTTVAVDVSSAVTNAALSNTSFDFGQNLVNNTLTQTVVAVTNTGASDLLLSPAISGDASFTIDAPSSCGTTLAAGTSCNVVVNYDPATPSAPSQQTAQLNLGYGDVPSGTPQTVTLTGTASALTPGTVSTTNNPQVALYTMTLPFPGAITVNFGTDTTYGKSTWSQSTTSAGGQVSILVAGMLPNTMYHMQASVQFTNGITATDVDHTFNNGAPLFTPNISVATTPGMTPQSGVEEITTVTGQKGIIVTDLQGRILWSYVLPHDSTDDVQGVQLLPNGHFLFSIAATTGPSLSNINAVQEVDLAGNIVREIWINDINNELQAKSYNITLSQLSHDILQTPNGHWIILGSTVKNITTLPAYPHGVNVTGDVLVDLDTNLQVDWAWNTFDHLDITRQPMGFPDWTHGNAVIYSPGDHDLIFSMRHQNWVIKINYDDAAGDGSILWHLGKDGEFTLAGGMDPTDWNYAQHYPSLVDPNVSTGIFSMILMNNGDDRFFPSPTGQVQCGTGGYIAGVCYSTIPIFQIDESAMTATITFQQGPDTNTNYNNFGGSADVLANGDIEFDLCGIGANSFIYEVTPTHQTVWEMAVTGSNAYRGYRIPSLYPGVQW